MGRRRRATPYFHPSSSLTRVAAFLPIPSRRHTPSNHCQPLSSFCLFLRSPFLPRSSSFRGEPRLSFRFSVVSSAASRCSNAPCYDTSRTRCCRYTFSLPFSFLKRLRETTAVFLSFYRRADIASSSSTLPPSFAMAPSRVVFPARSSLRRGRHGNARSAATGKFLRLSIFGKLPLSPRAPF